MALYDTLLIGRNYTKISLFEQRKICIFFNKKCRLLADYKDIFWNGKYGYCNNTYSCGSFRYTE